MAGSVHALVQRPNDDHSVVGHAKVDHVVADAPSAVTWPNVLTCRRNPGHFSQFGKGCREKIDVAISLFDAPLLGGVCPNALSRWGVRRYSAISSPHPLFESGDVKVARFAARFTFD